jgi:hypothetical protein
MAIPTKPCRMSFGAGDRGHVNFLLRQTIRDQSAPSDPAVTPKLLRAILDEDGNADVTLPATLYQYATPYAIGIEVYQNVNGSRAVYTIDIPDTDLDEDERILLNGDTAPRRALTTDTVWGVQTVDNNDPSIALDIRYGRLFAAHKTQDALTAGGPYTRFMVDARGHVESAENADFITHDEISSIIGTTSGLSGHLSDSAHVDDQSIEIYAAMDIVTAGGYLVVDAYTVDAEILEVASVADNVITFYGKLDKDHSIGADVLFTYYPDYHVNLFGAVGGDVDDTAAFTAAIQAAGNAGGGVVSCSNHKYTANILIDREGVHLRGQARSTTNDVTTYIYAADPAVPTLQVGGVGDVNTFTRSCRVENVAVYGDNEAEIGIFIGQGAYDCHIDHVSSINFTRYALKIGDLDQSNRISYIFINDITLQASGADDGLISTFAVYGGADTFTEYTTAVYINGFRLSQANVIGSRAVIIDNASNTFVSNAYWQIRNDQNVVFRETHSTFPRLYASNLNIDGTTSSGISVEVMDGFPLIASYIAGGPWKTTGKIKVGAGDKAANPGYVDDYAYTGFNTLRDSSLMQIPIAVGSIRFQSVHNTLGVAMPDIQQDDVTKKDLLIRTNNGGKIRLQPSNSDNNGLILWPALGPVLPGYTRTGLPDASPSGVNVNGALAYTSDENYGGGNAGGVRFSYNDAWHSLAVRDSDNAFSVGQGIRLARSTSLSDALYVPWVAGDTHNTAYFGKNDAANNQIALRLMSYSNYGLWAESKQGYGLLAKSQDQAAAQLMRIDSINDDNSSVIKVTHRVNTNASQIAISGSPAGGGFLVGVVVDGGSVAYTPLESYDVTALTLQNALNDIADIAAISGGSFAVTRKGSTPNFTFVIVPNGTLLSHTISISVDDTGLTGGTSPHAVASGLLPAAGLGSSIALQASTLSSDNSEVTDRTLFTLQATHPVIADAAYTSLVRMYAVDFAASRNVINFGADGSNPLIGFFDTNPTAKGSIGGSRGGNVALANLITYLAAKGLLNDGTSV